MTEYIARDHTDLHRKTGRLSAADIWLYVKINLMLDVLFTVVYGGTNWLAALHASSYRFFMEWERAIPLVPIMIYPYLSIVPLGWLPLFVLDASRYKRLGMATAMCIVMAGICFLLFPAGTGFYPALPPTPGSLPSWLIGMLHQVDQPYNTAPSLHVGIGTVMALVSRRSMTSPALSLLVLIWLGVLMASVVLLHQHHLVDVASGWLLGYVCYRYYCRG